MRYHYEVPSICIPVYGESYRCDHPVYSKCTLFKINNKGLAVIQQRYSVTTKRTWWTQIDGMAGEPIDGLYPTVTIRQLMWALKMKPIPRQPWETCFDHSPF